MLLVSYIGFPATAGEIEVQRHAQFLKGLQFVTESLSGKLPQRVLIPLSRFLHLPSLRRERKESSITPSSCADHPDTNVNLLNVTHTSSAHLCSDNNHSICHNFQSRFSWIKAHCFDKACGENHSHFYFNKHSDSNITYQNSFLEH